MQKGRDFRRLLDQHLASCGVFLVIIGKDWLGSTDEHGKRRIDNPDDFIRLETAAALKRDIPVIPVLVREAKMPRADELPDDLKDLVFREGVELTHARWDSDVQELIEALAPYVDADPTSANRQPGAGVGRRSWWIALGASVSTAVIAAGYVVYESYRKETAAQIEMFKREAEAAERAAGRPGCREGCG